MYLCHLKYYHTIAASSKNTIARHMLEHQTNYYILYVTLFHLHLGEKTYLKDSSYTSKWRHLMNPKLFKLPLHDADVLFCTHTHSTYLIHRISHVFQQCIQILYYDGKICCSNFVWSCLSTLQKKFSWSFVPLPVRPHRKKHELSTSLMNQNQAFHSAWCTTSPAHPKEGLETLATRLWHLQECVQIQSDHLEQSHDHAVPARISLT